MRKGLVLSVDDDADLQLVLGQYLETDGYEVIAAADIAAALENAEARNFDVILLDLVLPDGEGINLIPLLRGKSRAAIIVVSGKTDSTEKIVCLEMGADDYMTKPFELRELSARIKAILRRSNDNDKRESSTSAEADLIVFHGWRLDRAQYQLFNDKGKSADLTTGEFKLIEALLLSPNKALTRDRLFELTRGEDYDSYDRAIDIQIARIRKKLKKESGLIKTIRGIGYMFSGEASFENKSL